MIIGVPKEVKSKEYRVGLTPSSVRELTKRGHAVVVETTAGLGIDFTDKDYEAVGAEVVANAREVFAKAKMIVKVKEPQEAECELFQEGQTLFTFLHLAPIPKIAKALIDAKVAAIAYETVTDSMGGLPLLAPMSEVAGRLSVQVGARHLEKVYGGRGILLGGVPGVARAEVVIIGGGVVGSSAINIAVGMGAKVTVLDKSVAKLTQLDKLYGWQISTQFATSETIEDALKKADLVIGAVLIPGASAPKIITRDLLRRMKKGSVVIDVAIDQGGCLETSRPTTYEDPTFIEEGVIHYCVANMPSGVPRTSAFALNNVTLPFVLELAESGYKKACLDNPNLLAGLNVCNGYLTHKALSESLSDLPYIDVNSALK